MPDRLVVDFAHNLNICSSDIANFIGQNWLRQTLLSDKGFYHWQFYTPPANDGKDHTIIALLGTQIIGFLGLNKRLFMLNGTALNGAELTTWIINNNFQGKGYAKPMLKLITDNFDIVYGANITTDALRVYLAMGFNYIKQIPRFVKVYDYEKVRQLGEISAVIQKKYPSAKKNNGNYKKIALEALETNATNNGFARSAADIAWRYKNHPVYQYEAIELAANPIIYRLEEVNGAKIMVITDIIANSENLNFSGLDSFAANEAIDMIDFYSTDAKINSILQKSGFIPMQELSEFIDLIYLYNPPETKKSKSYSMIYYAKEPYLRDCFNYGNIYLTKADCDLDRPNYNYLEKTRMQVK
jgi:hypothetical protein